MPNLCRIGLVGRPNVGKSSLYNRLLGKRIAVVADQAGTTRDRLESNAQFGGHDCVLFDLAGIETRLAEGELNRAVQEQVSVSVEIHEGCIESLKGAARFRSRLKFNIEEGTHGFLPPARIVRCFLNPNIWLAYWKGNKDRT